MEPTTWQRLESLFFEALEKDPAERDAWLQEACAGDPALLEEARAVLAAHMAVEEGGPDEVPPDRRIGTRVGAWRLDRLLGRGGMGEVYLARRDDDQYEQEAAVKLVRSGLPTHEMIRRFRVERQILAHLEHPNVATLMDGGVTPEGQPYLVMQYVRGVPIDEYADVQRLAIRERLRLFVAVCRTVQFAHSRLVVHRDLKPSNILVTGEGGVRLLDFGIAKLLDAGDWAPLAPTESLLLLTPEHAAPEQFLGLPVGTATDVYQLGVLLYLLVTGSRPFRGGTSFELHRAICEQEPERPSTRVVEGPAGSTQADTVAMGEAARFRGTTPRGLEKVLRGDLDRIILMALRKEPERRYPSVAAFADDVERYLDGYPVQARPEGFGYVAGRFVRRHRGAVTAAAGLVLSLVALTGVSLRFAATSARQAEEVRVERDVALEVSSFLETLFQATDPYASRGVARDTMRIRDFLDEGARRVQEELEGQPLVQARLLATLGRANRNLGRLDEAAPLLEEARAVLERIEGPDSPNAAGVRVTAAQLRAGLGDLEGAEELARRSIAVLAADSVTHARNLAQAWAVLGNIHQEGARYEEAEEAYRKALSLHALAADGDEGRRAEHLSNLATALTRSARFTEAEALLEEAVALARSTFGDTHPTTATFLNNLGQVREDMDDLDGAETALTEALAIRRERFSGPTPDLASSVNAMGNLRLARGDLAGAEALFRESLGMRQTLHGANHPATGLAWMNLAAVLQQTPSQRAAALEAYDEARAILAGTLGPTHPLLGGIEGNLGRLHHDSGDHARALEQYRKALAIRRETFDDTHPAVLGNLSDIGRCLMELGQYTEAEELLLQVVAGLEPIREEQPRMYDGVLVRLARLYRAMGREGDALEWEERRTTGSP